ncbi:PAS domain-containing sensor histidine kinase [Mucilaginibacter aquaedulcis]|jgi:PAS domain S-box-containing protein|uniref:PAS domain-containing sensor histidine kinase n=1 Tax=Mucilaginibacter aquaedulcis TaxID=1187081 RepID=UPI0025B3401E|nr:ATP-binding protein [Mucilaginibacter aquaedulcis]MDN3549519.1 PAS domain-containing protein [Mucilaginibacter aquaedulcis]
MSNEQAIDNMSFSEDKFSDDSRLHLAQIIDNINAGIWEYNINTRVIKWSAGFYTLLGYEPGEIECSNHTFFEQLLYHQDKTIFLNALTNQNSKQSNPVQVRLLTKSSGYHWFESTVKRYPDTKAKTIYGSIINIHDYKQAQLKAARDDLNYADTLRIAKLGSWEIEAGSLNLTLSKHTYDIFELQAEVKLTIDEVISFFEPQHRATLQTAINNALEFCQPYDLELLFRTAKNHVLWVKAKGVPIINEYGKCIIVKNIIQDIDNSKRKGLSLESSLNLLTDQNKRLQNFAYIVSHNLRSHTGNLQFMVKLYEETDVREDRAEIFSHIKSIGSSLNSTIEHLNEIVKIQTEITNERSVINFESIFKNVQLAIKSNIDALNAHIEYDFSQCTEISYVPAYMESILQNLLTNALKYSHPDRQPFIKCYTIKDRNYVYLIFEDNGIGIDLERYGDKVFGMYKTFHQNPDARGIGLFITRNQIEALGGTIKVESTVNIGTKFTIKLV